MKHSNSSPYKCSCTTFILNYLEEYVCVGLLGMLSVGQTDNFRPIRADKILKRNERNLSFFSRFWVANPQTNAHLAELKQEKIYFTEYHR